MTDTPPPQANELEFSLFGPGVGECLVVDLGDGNWMVVDSCLNGAREKPVAIEYLESLGVDVGRQVQLVVATHWHDDHVRGISEVVRQATSADFACSGALQNKEFLELVVADEQVKLVEATSGVSEFTEVLNILDQRVRGRRRLGPDHWAASGTILYRAQEPHSVEVHALSPSAQSLTASKGQVSRLIPSLSKQPIGRFPQVSPNYASVALLVKTGELHFLLGADLETGKDPHCGWQAVLASKVRPDVASSVYKVAHHGSENADHEGIWRDLLVEKPIAILTPFAGGRKPLPSQSDIDRIKSKADCLLTTIGRCTKRPTRRRGVDKTMNEVARTRWAVSKCPGHIRLRVPAQGMLEDMRVEVFSGAQRM